MPFSTSSRAQGELASFRILQRQPSQRERSITAQQRRFFGDAAVTRSDTRTCSSTHCQQGHEPPAALPPPFIVLSDRRPDPASSASAMIRIQARNPTSRCHPQKNIIWGYPVFFPLGVVQVGFVHPNVQESVQVSMPGRTFTSVAADVGLVVLHHAQAFRE